MEAAWEIEGAWEKDVLPWLVPPEPHGYRTSDAVHHPAKNEKKNITHKIGKSLMLIK